MPYTKDMVKKIHNKPFILGKDEHIGSITTENSEIFLLSSHDNTEVIRLKLKKDATWSLAPSMDGSHIAESMFIISGSLLYKNKKEQKLLQTGNFISLAGLPNIVQFIAQTPVEFIYFISKEVFHHYSKSLEEVLLLATQVEEKDGYTAEHCKRIRDYSFSIGEYMDLKTNTMHNLRYGSFLHDIGKVKIPDSILGKPSKLTNEEWKIMKQHTLFGSEMIKELNISSLINSIPIIEQHHERYNGSGYPYGLSKNEIDIGAAIVAVVDSYDAITTERVYKKASSKDEAVEEIKRNREILYHPEVVDAFLEVVDTF